MHDFLGCQSLVGDLFVCCLMLTPLRLDAMKVLTKTDKKDFISSTDHEVESTDHEVETLFNG